VSDAKKRLVSMPGMFSQAVRVGASASGDRPSQPRRVRGWEDSRYSLGNRVGQCNWQSPLSRIRRWTTGLQAEKVIVWISASRARGDGFGVWLRQNHAWWSCVASG